MNQQNPTGGAVSKAPTQTGSGGSIRSSSSRPFTAKVLGRQLPWVLLCSQSSNIGDIGITYLVKKAYAEYKKSQNEADERDNDRVRGREHEHDAQEQPQQQDDEPEPPENDDTPPNNDRTP